ncbi:MAG: DUF1073 domain-containing protein [Chloroflexota bacterium]|nr:DUF1073 domain-containing protein [Chloroflexota bacterium]
MQTTMRHNSLYDLVGTLTGGGTPGEGTLSSPAPLSASNAYTPLSLNRILLSYSYMTQGLVQTVVRQPVADAFRGGVAVVTPDLDEDEKARLRAALYRSRRRTRELRKLGRRLDPASAASMGNSDIQVVQDTLSWARLYGGAGLIVNTDQGFARELDPERIGEDSELEFIDADRWELVMSQTDIWNTANPTPYNYYGLPLHRSRVLPVLGVKAPSYIRLRLQGWGMSEIERCIRPINAFVKFEALIFELLDEAKVDVYKIQGFNDSLLTNDGTEMTSRRIQLSNQLKNFQNALAMDKEDDYTQKQITWSGLAEVWTQLRLNLSSALRIPMNKLFGESATGFGGGEDALENYNTIVESIRDAAEPLLGEVVDLRCRQLFGRVPDYDLEWQPLKVLDGVQSEQVKTQRQARVMDLFKARLVTGLEASRMLHEQNLLPTETEVLAGKREVEFPLPGEGGEGGGSPKAGEKEVSTAKPGKATEKP